MKLDQAIVASALLLAACSRGERDGVETADAAVPAAELAARPEAGPTVDAAVDAEATEVEGTNFRFDAGTSACRALRSPYIDPDFIAPVALHLEEHGGGARLVFNESGVPRTVEVPPDARDAGAPVHGARTRDSLPACVVSGDAVVCPDASGIVQVWRGEKHAVIAHARPGTDLAAARIGGKLAVAFVMDHVTAEEVRREAWVVLEGGEPVRLSEEGSGATFVALAQRQGRLLALTIDARVAMTPTHARTIALEGGHLALGSDAVVFVGGSAEPHNAGALAVHADGSAFALVAVADGASSFGMAAIRVEDPPRIDEPVVWSLYPNGLDPAPIAATTDSARMLVARVRPRDAAPHARRDLELGELAKDGSFVPSCVIDEAGFIKDVEIALDPKGALWVFYRDPRGSVLERRALPPRR